MTQPIPTPKQCFSHGGAYQVSLNRPVVGLVVGKEKVRQRSTIDAALRLWSPGVGWTEDVEDWAQAAASLRLLVCTSLKARRVQTALERLSDDRVRCMVATFDAAKNVRLLLGTSVRDVVFLPGEAVHLPRLLTRAVSSSTRDSWIGRVRLGPPTVLSGAITLLLRTMHPDTSPPPRSVAALARQIGSSAGYLRARARHHDLDLTELINSVLILRALSERDAGATWTAAAMKVGYADSSGLRKAASKHLGLGLGQLVPQRREIEGRVDELIDAYARSDR